MKVLSGPSPKRPFGVLVAWRGAVGASEERPKGRSAHRAVPPRGEVSVRQRRTVTGGWVSRGISRIIRKEVSREISRRISRGISRRISRGINTAHRRQ
jgi:hypothetical protein